MTYNYFEETINLIFQMYETKRKIDSNFQKVFGNDTTIISSFFEDELQKSIENLAKELNDTDEWIEYLLFEVMFSNTNKDYEITLSNGTKLIANTKSIWFLLTGEEIV